ncbi:MAG: hypothetical protein LBK59_08925 [Bifidobacteriaceae bacterium]|jgi:hypothetical protein|nr:hypothetical protein [Bifidobacteriaceae bacterium]
MVSKALACVVGVLLAAGAMAGCSDSASESPGVSPTPSRSADADQLAMAQIVWDVDDAGAPSLAYPLPFRVSAPTAAGMFEGDGEELQMGDQVTFDSAVFDGETGEVLRSTYSDGEPEQLVMAQDAIEPTMLAALMNLNVGARFVYVMPNPEALDEAGITGGVGQNGTPYPSLLVAITVRVAEPAQP